MNRLLISLFAVIGVMCLSCQAGTLVFQSGQSNSLYPDGYDGVSDTRISEASPEANYGADWSLYSATDKEGKMSVTLMRWDIARASSLFDDTKYKVICAELELSAWYNHKAASHRYGIFELNVSNAGWVEGKGFNTNKPVQNAPSWSYKSYPSTKWNGADNVVNAAKSEPFAVLQTDSDSSGMLPRRLQRVRMPLDLVRSWATNAKANSGFIIKPLDETPDSGTLFVSSEHPAKDKHKWDQYRPRLIITYVEMQSTQQEPVPSDYLIHNGRSNFRVLIKPDQSNPIVENAVLDFCNHWKELAGYEITVIPEKHYSADMGPCISIGRTELSKKAASDNDLKQLGEDGLLITSQDGNVIIVGNTPRGTLYGVYEYLEDLGIRWLTKDVTHFPETKNIKLPGRKTYVPPFWFRETLWNSSSYDPTWRWQSRTRQNGQFTRIPPSLGGYYQIYPNDAHSIRHLVPKELRSKHPDWFALKPPLMVRAKTEEYCLTNPQFREHLLNGILKGLRALPDMRQIWIGQTDGTFDGCYCKTCTAERVAHGGKKRWSANMLGLLNYLGPRIKKDFPNVRLRTLAYSYYRVPPENMKVASDNITFMVCGPGVNWMVADSPENEEFYSKTVNGWRRTGASIMLWSYAGSNYGFWWPFPSWYFIGDNINQAYKAGVDAMFSQGTSGNYGSGLGEMNAFVSARLLWDPTRNGRDEIRDFTELYYGPAGKHIRQYMEAFYASIKESKLGTHHGWGNPNAWKKWVTPGMVKYGQKCFDRAFEATKDDPVLYKRVRAAWLPLLWARIHFGLDAFADKSKPARTKAGYTKDDLVKDAELFIEIMKENGYTGWRESHPAFNPDTHLRAKILHVITDARTIKLNNNFIEVEIAPLLGGRIVEWKVKGVEGNFFLSPSNQLDGYPYCGGYEELSQFAIGGSSSRVGFRVLSENRTRCTLQAVVDGNLRVTRKINIVGRKLMVNTTYENFSAKEVKMHLRSHPHFSLGMFDKASYQMVKSDGSKERVDMWQGKNIGQREYSVSALKGNSFVFENVGPMKGKLEVSYKRSEIDSVYVYWGNKASGAAEGVTIEAWMNERVVAPGEVIKFSQAFEYQE